MKRMVALVSVALGACGGEPIEPGPELGTLEQALSARLLTSTFEAPSTGSFVYQPITGATFFSAASVQGAQYDFGGWVPAAVGAQQAALQTSGRIERTVALGAGTHTLTFKARRSTQLGGSTTVPLQVLVDGAIVASVFPPVSTAFVPYTVTVTGPGNKNLAFVNGAGGCKTLLDDVKLVDAGGIERFSEGYEAPAAAGSFIYQPVTSDWVYTAAGVQRSAYVSGSWVLAAVGQQFGFLQSTGSMARVVDFPAAGNHVLTMRIARSPQLGGSMTLPLEVFVNGARVGHFTTSSGAWQTVSIPGFFAPAGRNVLLVRNAPGAALTFIDELTIDQAIVTVLAAGAEAPVTSSFIYQPVTNSTHFEGASVQGPQYDNGAWVPAAVGAQQASLQSSGRVVRTVALASGANVLSFKARRSLQAGGSFTVPLQVQVDGVVVANTLPSAAYESFSVSVAGPGTKNVAFVNGAGGALTMIDDVKVHGGGAVLLDESFEAPNAAGSFISQPVGSDWLYSGAQVMRSAYVNGGWLTAAEGQQFAGLQSGGSLRRVVAFAAGTHSLRVRLARSSQLGGSMALPVEIFVGATRVASYTLSNSTFLSITVPPFTVGAGNHVVRIENAPGAALTFVDDVVITR